MSVSVLLVRALVQAVELAGVRREDLFREAEFDASCLSDPDARVGLEEYDRLQALALDRTFDPALGLHMGEQVSLAAFDVVGHLVAHARTMRDGIDVFLRFHRILSDCADSKLVEKGQWATLEYEFPKTSPRLNRLRAEFGTTVLLAMGRHYVGRDKLAKSVYFEHEPPEYVSEYERIFGGTARFGHTFTGIEFDASLLDREQLHKNEELSQVLETEAQRKIVRLARGVGHGERLKEYLVSHAGAERPDMDTVARQLGMSARSLRRRLTEEGLSYGALVEEALAIVAKRLLDDPRRTIHETAYTMGFSDPSAFHRAFKRWTGMTPRQYRSAR
jgi:AraC-like DNA-binding protein